MPTCWLPKPWPTSRAWPILQDHAPTPDTVPPQLRSALTSRIVVEQAKGYLREHFDISLEDAFGKLRHHAHSHGEHHTDIARNLISNSAARDTILEAMESATPHRDT
jgi:hypothetical protein